MNRLVVAIVIIGLVVVAYAWQSGKGDTSEKASPTVQHTSSPATPKPDEPSRLMACSTFASMVEDMGDGLLTPYELRERIKKVYNYTEGSEFTEIRNAGKGLLAAATSGTEAEIVDAMSAMATACRN